MIQELNRLGAVQVDLLDEGADSCAVILETTTGIVLHFLLILRYVRVNGISYVGINRTY